MGEPVLVVNYHYCTTEEERPSLARTAVLPERFARQMATLKASGKPCLVTFDDGTRDVFENALPVLVRLGLPAVFFCCTKPLVEKKFLNVTKTHMLQGKMGFEAFRESFLSRIGSVPEAEMDDPERLGLGTIYRYDQEETRRFKLLLNVRLPYPLVTSVLDGLFEEQFGSQEKAVDSVYMSAEEIKLCRDKGVTIGVHTHSHFMLSRLSAAEQEREIALPADFFADLLGERPDVFSYPFGVAGTWNDETKKILARLGFAKAYTLGRRLYDPAAQTDSFEIPRFDVNDVFDKDDSLKRPS